MQKNLTSLLQSTNTSLVQVFRYDFNRNIRFINHFHLIKCKHIASIEHALKYIYKHHVDLRNELIEALQKDET